MECPEHVRLDLEQVHGVTYMPSQKRGHLADGLKQRGKDFLVRPEHRIRRVDNIIGHISVIRVDDYLY